MNTFFIVKMFSQNAAKFFSALALRSVIINAGSV